MRNWRASFLVLTVLLLPSLVDAQTGACWIHILDECYEMTREECAETCGCFCGEGSNCVDDYCLCDDIPSPEQCVVTPWDEFGQAFVTPGTQSGIGEVAVEVRNDEGYPWCAVVGIDVSDCEDLCVDPEDDGLWGLTDMYAVARLDPRVGGCADCPVFVRASGMQMRVYDRIRSTDWDGVQADGVVNSADFAFFATAFKQTQDSCADYNGDGHVSATDFSMFSASFRAADANEAGCR